MGTTEAKIELLERAEEVRAKLDFRLARCNGCAGEGERPTGDAVLYSCAQLVDCGECDGTGWTFVPVRTGWMAELNLVPTVLSPLGLLRLAAANRRGGWVERFSRLGGGG